MASLGKGEGGENAGRENLGSGMVLKWEDLGRKVAEWRP